MEAAINPEPTDKMKAKNYAQTTTGAARFKRPTGRDTFAPPRLDKLNLWFITAQSTLVLGLVFGNFFKLHMFVFQKYLRKKLLWPIFYSYEFEVLYFQGVMKTFFS